MVAARWRRVSTASRICWILPRRAKRLCRRSLPFLPTRSSARFEAFLHDCLKMVSVLQNDVLVSMSSELIKLVEDVPKCLDPVPDPYEDAKGFLPALTGKKDSHAGKVNGLSAQFSGYK